MSFGPEPSYKRGRKVNPRYENALPLTVMHQSCTLTRNQTASLQDHPQLKELSSMSSQLSLGSVSLLQEAVPQHG